MDADHGSLYHSTSVLSGRKEGGWYGWLVWYVCVSQVGGLSTHVRWYTARRYSTRENTRKRELGAQQMAQSD